jgi:hypothetical protein
MNPAARLGAGADAGFRKHAFESFLRAAGSHLNSIVSPVHAKLIRR